MSEGESDGLSRYSRDVRTAAEDQADLLIGSRIPRDEAVAELIDNGVPGDLAEATIDNVIAARRANWRNTAIGILLLGSTFVIGSAIIIVTTYITAEGEAAVLTTSLLAAGVAGLVGGALMLIYPRYP